jgi:hypothetical protein
VGKIGGYAPKAFLTFLAVAIVALGHHAVHEMHDLRTATRDLLLRCEIALGAFVPGRYPPHVGLYTDYELQYPAHGAWLKQNYAFVWALLAAFLFVVWCPAKQGGQPLV